MTTDDLQRRVYEYIRDNPGLKPKDIPWGLTDNAADVRLMFQRLITNGAVRFVGGWLNEIRARPSVDPMSKEDHSDCWPACYHFEEEDGRSCYHPPEKVEPFTLCGYLGFCHLCKKHVKWNSTDRYIDDP